VVKDALRPRSAISTLAIGVKTSFGKITALALGFQQNFFSETSIDGTITNGLMAGGCFCVERWIELQSFELDDEIAHRPSRVSHEGATEAAKTESFWA